MSENAFKNFINTGVVEKISTILTEVFPAFDGATFRKISKKLKPLELKQRVLLITSELYSLLPLNYSDSHPILLKLLKRKKLSGFELWPISEYISQYGLDHFDESMELMIELTKSFTSEFAIRPFLLKDPVRVLNFLETHLKSEDKHIRRWISEGTRPILPWGGKIPLFIEKPMTLHLLESLKFDDELYVRKSVANHLNDISKNHPDTVVQVLKRWQKEAPEDQSKKMAWIKRHALRTLIKKGHKGALELMGASHGAKVELHSLKLNKKIYKLGESLKFEFTLESTSKKAQTLIVDYLISFLKANGSMSSKVFKLKTLALAGGDKITLSKFHSLKKITTMEFYPGTHEVLIQVNGVILQKASWKFHC